MSNRKLFPRFLATFCKYLPTRIRTYLGVSHTGRKYPYWVEPTCVFISEGQMGHVSYICNTITICKDGYTHRWSYPQMSGREFVANSERFFGCKYEG